MAKKTQFWGFKTLPLCSTIFLGAHEKKIILKGNDKTHFHTVVTPGGDTEWNLNAQAAWEVAALKVQGQLTSACCMSVLSSLHSCHMHALYASHYM